MTATSKPLIFTDAQVPRAHRCSLTVITALCWFGWLDLWLPMLHRFAQGKSASPALAQLDAEYGVLIEQASLSGVFFVTVAAVFASWIGVRFASRAVIARLQRSARAQAAAPLSSRQLAASFQLEHALLQQWQSVQVAIAHHADDTGWLRHVEPGQSLQLAA